MKRILAILLTATVMVVVVLTDTIPLGISGEWQWQRHALPSDLSETLQRGLPAILAGALLFGVAIVGERRIDNSRRRGLWIRYAFLVAVAWFWVNQVQRATPSLHRDLKPYWVLYDRSSAGYFFEATFEMQSLAEFLQTYEDRMLEGEVLHIGTHPPGLFILSKLCLKACETSPLLTSLLKSVEDPDVRSAFRTVESEVGMARRLTAPELAGLHLLSLSTTFLMTLTLIPLAVLLHQIAGRICAWRICCLWPTLPCLAVFLPKSDLLFPFTCTSVLACCVMAMSGRWRIFYSVVAAAVLWIGMMLSLAHLPTGVVIAFMVMIRACRSSFETVKADTVMCLIIAFTLIVLSFAFSWFTGCDILTVWKLNLQNHEGFYSQFTRTWWKWTLANPVELAFAVGPVVAVAASVGWFRAVRQIRSKASSDTQRTAGTPAPVVLASFLTLILLWLSGKNQGEAARLWCFLTPWVLLAATDLAKLSDRCWKPVFVIQLVTASVIVGGVSGFSF